MNLKANKAYLLVSDGDAREIVPENGRDFQLKEAQKYVDGLIEVIHLTGNLIMIINEEGKLSKPYNPTATITAHASKAIRDDDYIAGDAIICFSDMLK